MCHFRIMKWTTEEKKKLADLAQHCVKDGRIQWTAVSSHFESRTPNQCKTMFINNVCKCNSRGVNLKWDEEMEQRLSVAVSRHGHKWEYIVANYFPDLSAIQLRHKYSAICQAGKVKH